MVGRNENNAYLIYIINENGFLTIYKETLTKIALHSLIFNKIERLPVNIIIKVKHKSWLKK